MIGVAGAGEDDIDAALMAAKTIGRFRQRRGVGFFEQETKRIVEIQRSLFDGAFLDQLGTHFF